MRRISGVILLVLLCAAGAQAAPAWAPEGPDGGTMTDIVRSPTNPAVVYAAGGRRVWRSIDAGATWSPFGLPIDGPIDGLEVGAAPAEPVLAFSGPRMFRSVAGGPWKLTETGVGPSYRQPTVMPGDRRRIVTIGERTETGPANTVCSWVVTGYSEDGGLSWGMGDPFYRRCGLADDPSKQLYFSSIVADPAKPATLWATVLDRASGSALFRTDDLGRTWQQEVVPTSVYGVAIPPPSTELVIADGFQYLHRPLAGGSWSPGMGACTTAVPEAFLEFPQGQAISCATGSVGQFATNAVAQAQGGFAALASARDIGVVRFDGTQWQPSNAGLRAQGAFSAVRLSDGSIVMKQQLGVYHSTAAGGWEPWFTGVLPNGYYPGLEVDGAGNVLVIEGAMLYRRGAGDLGWTGPLSPFNAVAFGMARGAGPGRPLYLIGLNGIYVSDDDGDSWPRLTPFAHPELLSVAPAPGNPAIAYLSAPDGTYRTADRGATWQRVQASPNAPKNLRVDPSDPNHVFGVATVPYSVAVFSRDGGATWSTTAGATLLNGYGYSDLAFDPRFPGIIYAATQAGLYATIDDGRSWGPLIGPDPFQRVTSFMPGPVTAAGWSLHATLDGPAAGLSRVDPSLRPQSIVGTPRVTGRRTGQVSTCTGARITGGPAPVITWFAGNRKIGSGPALRVPEARVGLPLRCEFRLESPFAHAVRTSASLPLIGRPYPKSRAAIQGSLRVGDKHLCGLRWLGRPTRLSYAWRVGGKVRGTHLTYRVRPADAGRRLTCTATARNRFGSARTVSKAVVIRK